MTLSKFGLAAFVLPALMLMGADQSWKNKEYSEWTDGDAKEVMTNSPWAKTLVVTPVKPNAGQPGSHRSRVGFGGFGMGRRGSGEGDAAQRAKTDGGAANPDQPATLTLRWESAQPVRQAELKARNIGAPDVADDYYAIAVYGIPRGTITDDSKELQNELKKLAVLRRDGKKEVKPIRVDILLRESGPLVVYLFAKSAEFTWRDHRITLEAQISRLKFSQAFSTDDMTFHGKLEL